MARKQTRLAYKAVRNAPEDQAVHAAETNKGASAMREMTKVRIRRMPPGLAAMTLPTDRVIECDASLAALLVSEGYADAVEG